MNERIATGHLDCNGKMIHEGDTVETPVGKGTVVRKNGQWRLLCDLGSMPMNSYGADALRVLGQ